MPYLRASVDRLEMSSTNVNLLTIQELRQHLREHKLPTQGTKQQLQDRLQMLLSNNNTDDNDTTDTISLNTDSTVSKLRVTIEKQGSSKQCSLVTPNTVDKTKLYEQLLVRAANKFRFKSKRIFEYSTGIEVLPNNIYDIIYDGCKLIVTSGAVHTAVNKQLNPNSTSPIPSSSPIVQQNHTDTTIQQQMEQFSLDDNVVIDLYNNNSVNSSPQPQDDEEKDNNDTIQRSTSSHPSPTTSVPNTPSTADYTVSMLHHSASSSPMSTPVSAPNRTLELLEKRCKRVEAENKQLLKQNDKLTTELSKFNTTVQHVAMMEQKIQTLTNKLELAQNNVQKAQRDATKYKSKSDTLSATIEQMTEQANNTHALQSNYDTVLRQLQLLTGTHNHIVHTNIELQWALDMHSSGLKRVTVQIATNIDNERKQLLEQQMCKICYERKSEFVALPCAHLYCEKCILRIGSECSHCRRTIEQKKQVYF